MVETLDVRGAAELLAVHVETVRRLARKGEIPAFKVGRDWRFRREALLQWTEAHHPDDDAPLVLVVDDERAIRMTFRVLLEKAGWRVVVAEDGRRGLESAEQEPPDVVILDLAMPRMDGVAFLEKFVEIAPQIPVLVCTGYPDSRLMADAAAVRPITLLAKPVPAEQLVDAVRNALAGTRADRTRSPRSG
jgi:excisionase family DNA binding protein